MAKDKPAPKTVDPLAAAAVPGPGAPTDDNFDAPDTAPAAVTTPATPPPEPNLPPPGAAPAAKKAPTFEVERAVTLSWGTSFIKLQPGDLVSDEGYGDGAVEKMRLMGAALKPVGD